MSEMVSLTGIVLSCIPVGEYDNRIVILTKERGKICAFAKGARKMHSHLMGLTRPFLMGRFDLYEGREAYTLAGGESREYFEELSKDLNAVYYGFYFLEIADYYGREGIEAKNMLNLLYVSFKALTDERLKKELVKCVFELKAMMINGEYPETFCCVGCKTKDELRYFSVSRGGVLCETCAKSVHDAAMISSDVLYTLQYVISAKLESLYSFTLDDATMQGFENIMKLLRKTNFDKHFKSLDMLEIMKI